MDAKRRVNLRLLDTCNLCTQIPHTVIILKTLQGHHSRLLNNSIFHPNYFTTCNSDCIYDFVEVMMSGIYIHMQSPCVALLWVYCMKIL